MALGSFTIARRVRKRLIKTEPYIPDKKGFKRVDDTRGLFETKHFIVGFDPVYGGIIHLMDKETDRNWAGNRNQLALFTYETFSQKEYNRFLKQYQYPKEAPDWYEKDFSKPGIESVSKSYKSWHPKLIGMWLLNNKFGTHLILELKPPQGSSQFYGCPAKFFMELDFPKNEKAIFFNFQWFNKKACRLPEAIWLSFSPKISDPEGWMMEKLGEFISPFEVIRNGNRKLHAVGKGVEYHDERGGLIIETLDAPLVATGEMSLLNFNNKKPPMKRGMHFNLYNNIWGTNFPMWFEEDARFRFILKFIT